METATPARADTAALLAAVFCFDVVAAGRILDHHLRRFGVLDTWDELVRPVFGAIEAQQAGGARCIDVEHALSWAVTRCLQRLPMAAPDLESAIILACTEHEAHTLALDALRAALAEREIGAVMLGAAVPSDAIIDALNRRSATCTVVVWSQSAATADSGTAEAILAAGARAILAGPGWSSVSVPSAHKVMSLQEALAKVAAR